MINPTQVRSQRPPRLLRRIGYGVIAFMATLGIGLAAPPASQAGWLDLIFNGIQVLQISTLSNQDEVNLGSRINQQLIDSGEFRLYNNAAINTYVNDIGQRLVPYSDRPGIPYRFQVVQDDSVNAFATMGGYVYVTTGLLRAADNEAEVAGVLGHEIGHIAGRDTLEQMKQVAIARGITGALGLSSDQWVNLGVEVALNLPASRQDEYAADRHGFQTMGEAGYDQAAMVSFMQKLVRSGAPPEFLSTHPDARNRVSTLQRMLDQSAIPSATDGMSEAGYDSRISALR
jgi:predicted Zn-dependent protease